MLLYGNLASFAIFIRKPSCNHMKNNMYRGTLTLYIDKIIFETYSHPLYRNMNTTSFQATGYNHAQQTQVLGTSGLKIFGGQDLTAGDRKRLQQLQANNWYQQQVQEKQKRKNNQQFEKQLYDQQTLQINQYRKQLEQEKAHRLTKMQIAYKNFNKQQLEQKLNREALQRKLDQQERHNHIEYVTGNDFYTENTKTCQSELNRNRVKPYHWKGMNQDQRREVLQEQEKQRRERELHNQLQEQQNKLFAEQMEAQRKAIILQERAKTRGLQNVRKGVDQYNKLKAEQMKRKAYNAFDHVHTYKNQG